MVMSTVDPGAMAWAGQEGMKPREKGKGVGVSWGGRGQGGLVEWGCCTLDLLEAGWPL